MNKSRRKQPLRGRQRWVCRLLLPLVVVVMLMLIMEGILLPGPSREKLTGLHRAIGLAWLSGFDNVLSSEETVADEDSLHLSLLHEICMEETRTLLPWQLGSPGNQGVDGTASNADVLVVKNNNDLLQKLRQCPDVDVFLPDSARTFGYCQDAVAYVKYLNSRLLPEWVLDVDLIDPDLGREVNYFDLCPKTPMLFLDHQWGELVDSSEWPEEKPVYMMANIEKVEVAPTHFLRADVVLCKIHECYERVTKWLDQFGNPRNATVFYTKHTSLNLDVFARKRLGEHAVAPKDYSNVKFVHTAGVSSSKGTREVLECWTTFPDLPPLDVYIDRKPFYHLFPASYKMKIARSKNPIKIHLGMQKSLAYSKIIAEASFIVNPSYSEGYGHILNQARATGAVIVTTDIPPMNELVTANKTGVLIPVERRKHPMVVLGGKYRGGYNLNNSEGLVGAFEGSAVCEAIRQVLQLTTPGERAEMGFNARRQYNADTNYFAKKMEEVKDFAKR